MNAFIHGTGISLTAFAAPFFSHLDVGTWFLLCSGFVGLLAARKLTH